MKNTRGHDCHEVVPRTHAGSGILHHPSIPGPRAVWLLLGLLVLVAPLLLVGGCDDDEVVAVPVDQTPPPVPTGIFSVTGDGFVTVYWNDIYDEDLAGYDVYRYQGDDPVGGAYNYIGSVAWDENFDSESLLHWFDDLNVVNGETYYYAVLAYDYAGNESYLSFETIVDTPRPAGYDLVVFDRAASPIRSGVDFYDFDMMIGAEAVPYDAVDADVYVTFSDGVPFVEAAREGILLQDYGTVLLDWADYAPADGYSATGRLELITGHAYIVRIVEEYEIGGTPIQELHYAKFGVTAIGADAVTIDWAYQVDRENPELGAPDGPPAAGGGAAVVRF